MPLESACRIARIATGRLMPILAIPCALLLSACGGDDDPTDTTDDVIGTWFSENDVDILYYEITSSRVTVYRRAITGLPCFTFVEYDIEGVDANTYTLAAEGEAAIEVTIEREDDEIVIDGERRLAESDVDVDDLDICSIPVTCASVPAIAFPDTVSYPLTNEQPQHVFSFTLTSTTTVRVDMASDDFDPNVTLFDDAGVFIAQNNDFIGNDARITRTLPAGCYMVMATRNGFGTGTYTLSIVEP